MGAELEQATAAREVSMTTPANIERFNRFASETFSLLYGYFPSLCEFDTTDFNVDMNEFGGVADNEEADAIIRTVEWLAEEGYIRYSSRSNDGRFYAAVLSAKGLAVLRLIPDAVSDRAPLGEQMQAAVKGGAGKLASQLIDKALDAGIRYAMAAHGG